MSDTVPATTGLDTASAGDLMAGLLSDDLMVSDPGSAPDQAPDASEKTPDEHVEGDEAPEQSHETQSEDDAGEDAGEGSEESEESEEATEGEDEPDEQPEAQPKTVTVTIDGKSVEVPLEEAVKGYQRQQDYSRKTAALADERRAFDGLRQEFDGERQAVAQERGQYKHLLKALSDRLAELEPQEPDWQALYARDKNEYLLQRDNWRAIQEQRAAATAELERVAETERAEAMKVNGARVKAAAAKLLEWEPKWQDAAVRQKDLVALMSYAKDKLGYTDQELASANDPRALYAVYKAMQFDALQAKAANVRQQAVKPKAKTLPAGSAARQVSTQQRQKGGAMKRLAKSGRVEDAAPLMSNFLEL